MATAKYLKETLERIAGIKGEVARIESPENRKRMESIHPTGNIWPGMFGELSGVVSIASSYVASALRQVEAVERLERIASAFESLDIDLSDESLKALELMASTDRYRTERGIITDAMADFVRDVQEQEREREYQEACNAIEAAGFGNIDGESDSTFVRGNECIQIEMRYQNNVTTYIWSLDRDGAPVDSGKSGEFSRLLAAISPVVQEVKA